MLRALEQLNMMVSGALSFLQVTISENDLRPQLAKGEEVSMVGNLLAGKCVHQRTFNTTRGL